MIETKSPSLLSPSSMGIQNRHSINLNEPIVYYFVRFCIVAELVWPSDPLKESAERFVVVSAPNSRFSPVRYQN